MNLKEYQALAMRTRDLHIDLDYQYFAGCLGLTGEAGEVAELFKKHVFHGHPLDNQKVAKELGDVLWYIALLCDAIDVDLETVAQMNIDKLRARYPEGFSAERSINRED